MSDSGLIFAIDFGTSALKCSVCDRDLAVLQSEKEEYPYILLPGEKVEIDPAALVRALESVCGRLRKDLRERVDLFCYGSFSPSLVLMDEAGNALSNVVTHMDRRSRKQSELICETMGKEKYQSIAGVYPFTGGVSLTTLLWFVREEPGLIGKTRKIGHLPTYFHKMFTGVWAVDLVNASMMGLYDTVGQSGWSEEILGAFNIPGEWLSPICTPGEHLGVLQNSIAARLGLPAGIPVAMGTNDVVAAHAGAGNDRAGQILNTAGSSDMVSILVDKPVLNPNYYVRNAGVKGLWQIYATTSGGFAIEWFYKEFCRDLSKEEFYGKLIPASLERLAVSSVSFAPYLAEDRQSLERRTASWAGLTLGTTREDMLGALLHAMQKVLADTVALAAERVSVDATIKITGGMTADSIMNLKRSMFPGYSFSIIDECTSRGAAVLALKSGK